MAVESAHVELNAEDFPFTLRWLSKETGKIVYALTVTGPGEMEAPGQDTLGEPCDVELIDKGGKSVYQSWT